MKMDILKELFGTSDEVQISKSLFGGDTAASASEELGLGEPPAALWRESRPLLCVRKKMIFLCLCVSDHPPESPSRDYLSSRPLPLLPVEPRPQSSVTSSLFRSQSLDDLHTPSSNDVDSIFRLVFKLLSFFQGRRCEVVVFCHTTDQMFYELSQCSHSSLRPELGITVWPYGRMAVWPASLALHSLTHTHS